MSTKIKNNIIPILKVIIFFTIFLCLFVYLSYMMKPNSENLRNISGYYGEKKNTLDMVYVGGSACFVYWVPLYAYENYGIVSYNFGANSVQAELYKTLIKEILKTQHPKLIIIDARTFQYKETVKPNEVYYRNFLTGMNFSKNKLNFINENVKKTLDMGRLSFIFDIIKYHRSFLSDDINENAVDMIFQNYKNDYKGFHFVINTKKIEKESFETEEKVPVAKETEDILLDLIDYLKTTDTKYLFAVSPYQETVEHKKQFNYLEEIIKKSGYNFLDSNEYYDEMNLDFDNDLYNDGHVNIFGAEKYTEFLSKYIKENYNLKDRRKDNNYNEWNNLLENWNAQVKYSKNEINKMKKAIEEDE